jgi:hypothetical protein
MAQASRERPHLPRGARFCRMSCVRAAHVHASHCIWSQAGDDRRWPRIAESGTRLRPHRLVDGGSFCSPIGRIARDGCLNRIPFRAALARRATRPPCARCNERWFEPTRSPSGGDTARTIVATGRRGRQEGCAEGLLSAVVSPATKGPYSGPGPPSPDWLPVDHAEVFTIFPSLSCTTVSTPSTSFGSDVRLGFVSGYLFRKPSGLEATSSICTTVPNDSVKVTELTESPATSAAALSLRYRPPDQTLSTSMG